jgi:hypothetical protein
VHLVGLYTYPSVSEATIYGAQLLW